MLELPAEPQRSRRNAEGKKDRLVVMCRRMRGFLTANGREFARMGLRGEMRGVGLVGFVAYLSSRLV